MKRKRRIIEPREVELVEAAKARQRAIAERLLLSALREQDAAEVAEEMATRAAYLAQASHDLSMSLDERETRDTVRRLSVPRPGAWCIVDVIESNGSIQRLPVDHPIPSKRALAQKLEELWPAPLAPSFESWNVPSGQLPEVVTHESGSALLRAAQGPANLEILGQIGFGSLLVVPLVVRGRVQGGITFLSREGDPPFTPSETAFAVDLSARCALALDNARLFREADGLRMAAESANQSKSRFLGSMSHELRTPLNAIAGYAELIELGIHGPVTAAQLVALERIKANQHRLLNLITEVLDFVRTESGRLAYHYGAVCVRDTFTEAVDMLDSLIQSKGLKIEVLACDPSALAWADPDRVRQILSNLVTNAVKYTHRGTITLSCSVVGDVVLAHVADTGPGIAPDKLGTIFEPFQQLHSSIADREGGVGLGLAISRDLARAMNGEIYAVSTLDVGSRFTLSLPLSSPEPAEE